MNIFRALFVIFAGISINQPAASEDSLDAIIDLNLQDLLALEVTSAAKKKQSLNETAAAVFVITREDIRRSGVTSIAEALRMVPGIQVASLDANKWAISSRGFNAQFANKLLVLLDGRSVYTPSFSGVYWDAQDTLLEDIERIEVIRGPGATLWGANAVNGVINIITRPAIDTRGTLAVAGAGNEEQFAHLRHGFELGDDAAGRYYLKAKQTEASHAPDLAADAGDDWQSLRGGFRFDFDTSRGDNWTVQGDIYENDLNQILQQDWLDPTDPANNPPDPASPYLARNIVDEAASRGYNLLLHWQRETATSRYSVQGYIDHSYRSEHYITQQIDTVDLEFQHNYRGIDGHDLVWGLGYRRLRYHVDSSFSVAIENPGSQTADLINGFIQDEISLNDRLHLTLGTKLEHNDYTGDEIQPNLRLAWQHSPGQTVWGALSRAVRTPSAVERGAMS